MLTSIEPARQLSVIHRFWPPRTPKKMEKIHVLAAVPPPPIWWKNTCLLKKLATLALLSPLHTRFYLYFRYLVCLLDSSLSVGGNRFDVTCLLLVVSVFLNHFIREVAFIFFALESSNNR